MPIVIAALILLIVVILIRNIRIVQQAKAYVIERLGAYKETWNVGMHLKVPFIERVAKVVVPDYQLSLAIGKEGQNARLAARLTGYKIDIKNETQAKDAVGFRYEDYIDADEDEYEEE